MMALRGLARWHHERREQLRHVDGEPVAQSGENCGRNIMPSRLDTLVLLQRKLAANGRLNLRPPARVAQASRVLGEPPKNVLVHRTIVDVPVAHHGRGNHHARSALTRMCCNRRGSLAACPQIDEARRIPPLRASAAKPELEVCSYGDGNTDAPRVPVRG